MVKRSTSTKMYEMWQNCTATNCEDHIHNVVYPFNHSCKSTQCGMYSKGIYLVKSKHSKVQVQCERAVSPFNLTLHLVCFTFILKI